MFEFIGTLSESKLISSTSNLERYDDDELSDLVVLYLCSLYMLYNDEKTETFAISYAKRTIQYGTDFDKWRTSGTDLYVILHGITDSEELHKIVPLGAPLLIRWLREMSNGHVRRQTHRTLFSRVDYNFKIKNTSIRSVRRLVMDWDTLTHQEKQLAMTRLLQLLKARAQKSELLAELQKMASRNKLIIPDAYNKETGAGGHSIEIDPHKTSSKGSNFLLALSGIAAGVAVANALDHKKKVKENATSGATGAASIATAVGGLGAGFDPNGDWGVYSDNKKKAKKPKQESLLIRR